MIKREPNFEYMKKVLARQVPERPVLFEFGMNMKLYERASGSLLPEGADVFDQVKKTIEGYTALGYDYAPCYVSDFRFFSTGQDLEKRNVSGKEGDSVSLNEGILFTDWESYEGYKWVDPELYDDGRLDKLKTYLPDGMKIMVPGPGGILENLEYLMGYDNLCISLYEEPELIKEVSDNLGKNLLKYYKIALERDSVGFICYNDDWGFNTQTLISPEHLREYIFPWVKQIVELSHSYNKPCVLHSCGYFKSIIDDIVDDMKFDARHSYEDNIMRVEDAYEEYGSRIAILGGIDLDFVCRETPENVYRRSREMLERTAARGGYALGTGNSVPAYVPYENYMAMIRAALEM